MATLKRNRSCGFVIATVLALVVSCAPAKETGAKPGFQDDFKVDKANLVSTGVNPYFTPLTPGYRMVFKHGKETLTIVVSRETKVVDGVECRIIEENEDVDGQPKERSRNYFAIDKTTNDVYYFGEDVDIYKDGKIDSHEGAWLSGVNGAQFGMMMPGKPKVGDKFYQERAPKVARDHCEIVRLDEKIETAAGKFEKCLKTKEGSDLESGSSHKLYAPGVGLVQDDEMVLVKIEKP